MEELTHYWSPDRQQGTAANSLHADELAGGGGVDVLFALLSGPPEVSKCKERFARARTRTVSTHLATMPPEVSRLVADAPVAVPGLLERAQCTEREFHDRTPDEKVARVVAISGSARRMTPNGLEFAQIVALLRWVPAAPKGAVRRADCSAPCRGARTATGEQLGQHGDDPVLSKAADAERYALEDAARVTHAVGQGSLFKRPATSAPAVCSGSAMTRP